MLVRVSDVGAQPLPGLSLQLTSKEFSGNVYSAHTYRQESFLVLTCGAFLNLMVKQGAVELAAGLTISSSPRILELALKMPREWEGR